MTTRIEIIGGRESSNAKKVIDIMMFRDVAENEVTSRVKRKSISNVSEMRSQSFSQPVMMEIETVSETLHTNSSSHG
jgi:hypothetical protein